MSDVKIEVAPMSIPLSNTGDVPLIVIDKNGGSVYPLPVGAAVTIPPGDYDVIVNLKDIQVCIATIKYYPNNFDVTPREEVKNAQFGVYVNLLNLKS